MHGGQDSQGSERETIEYHFHLTKILTNVFMFSPGDIVDRDVSLCLSVSGHSDSLLRSLVIGHLGRCEHEETVAESRKRLEAHASGKQPLIADLRAAVYRTSLMSGDEKIYETMLTVSICLSFRERGFESTFVS